MDDARKMGEGSRQLDEGMANEVMESVSRYAFPGRVAHLGLGRALNTGKNQKTRTGQFPNQSSTAFLRGEIFSRRRRQSQALPLIDGLRTMRWVYAPAMRRPPCRSRAASPVSPSASRDSD